MICKISKLYSPQRRRERRGNIFSFAAERAANDNLQPLRGMNSILSVIILVKEVNPILICPNGCCFSLSGLSAESEKNKLLCVLCVSSAAGGDTILLNNFLAFDSTENYFTDLFCQFIRVDFFSECDPG